MCYYYLFVCLIIFFTGGPGSEEEQGGSEFGTAIAPVQPGLIGLGFEETVAVAVTVTIITKIICVCGLLFIEYMFAPLCGVVLQTIIGFFAALFAVILSSFGGFISGIIDHIYGINLQQEWLHIYQMIFVYLKD